MLSLVSVVYRPPTLTELTSLAESLEHLAEDADSVEEMIGICGSLLTLQFRLSAGHGSRVSSAVEYVPLPGPLGACEISGPTLLTPPGTERSPGKRQAEHLRSR